MSQYPPPPDPYNNPYAQSNDPYASPPKVPGIALAALILGIFALPCLPLGIVGIILGINALSKISREPHLYTGRGMAIGGIVSGACFSILSVVALLIAILLPSLGKARELANRSTCAANLRGISQSMVVYSGDNEEYYPYVGPGGRAISPGNYEVVAKPATDTSGGGVMSDLFVLVGIGQVGPKQFICKSDPATVAPSGSPTSAPAFPGYSPTYWTSPTGGNPDFTYSYSFANPFVDSRHIGTWWKNTMDSAVPISADLNPGNQNTKAVKNSLNHQGDGQNIVFGDAHAEFLRTPLAGEDNDHIYNLGMHQPPSAPGTPGTSAATPSLSPSGNAQGTFDTWLVPAATDAAYTRQ